MIRCATFKIGIICDSCYGSILAELKFIYIESAAIYHVDLYLQAFNL